MFRGLLLSWIDADGSNFKLNEKQNIVLISPVTCNVTSSTLHFFTYHMLTFVLATEVNYSCYLVLSRMQ